MNKKTIDDDKSLIKGKVGRVLLKFAGPFLAASFLQALYGAVDLFVVGRYDTSSAVSAVAIGSQLMQTITGAVLGISIGGTVFIGHAIGQGNDEKAARGTGNLILIFAALALVITPLMVFNVRGITALMQTPQEAFEEAQRYIFICSLGIPFIVGYNGISGIFRGIGDSKHPMYFVAVACAVNISMDFILVGGFKMGAAGAAVATICAQSISLIVALVYIYRKGFPFAFGREHFRPYVAVMKYILKVGSPIAVQDALVNISFLMITVITNTMGLIVSASVGVVEKIIIFCMLPPTAFASAVATMTAQNLGAEKPKRAVSSLKYGIGYSLIVGCCVCLFSQFGADILTGIFTEDQQVIKTAADYMRSYSIDCILVSFIFCMNSYFSGCGRSMISFIHSMIATFGVRVPISYIISKVPGVSLYYMGFAPPAASIVSIIICSCYFIWLKKHQLKTI